MLIAVHVAVVERATVLVEASSIEAGVEVVRSAATEGVLRFARPARDVLAFATGVVPDPPGSSAGLAGAV